MARDIKVDSYVKTADGTEGQVTYISPDGEAEVYPKHGGENLRLPVTELRRIPDTYKLRPPIVGMPEDRPRCPFCNRPLQPDVRTERADHGDRYAVKRRVWEGWAGYAIERGNAFDKFCTLKCARDFASAAWRAGYRIKRGGS